MIRRPGTALLPMLLPLTVAVSAGAGAQASATGRRSWHAGAGVAYSTELVDDRNGPVVRTTWAPLAAAGMAWSTSPSTQLGVDLRASRAGVTVDDRLARPPGGGSSQWSAGSAWTLEAIASLEYAVKPALRLRGGLGLLSLVGPQDVRPFTSRGVHPSAELGAVVRLRPARPWYAAVVLQGYRLNTPSGFDPLEPGIVGRVVASVRYER